MLSVSHSQQQSTVPFGIGKTQAVRARRWQSRCCWTATEGRSRRRRVFLLDVNPLCYSGSRPSLECLGEWLSLLFRQVSLSDPVIAVLDGEGGAQRRRQLLPSYKAHRQNHYYHQNHGASRWAAVGEGLGRCGVPVVRVPGEEADDVIATLASQALRDKGVGVVIASPDKDFMQLLSPEVQMVMPLRELGRWSFYTLRHYASQHRNSHPRSDLSLRCLLGDQSDGVPGIQHLAPAFRRKTAAKLLSKHGGSLEELLKAAAVRTVGKQYAQVRPGEARRLPQKELRSPLSPRRRPRQASRPLAYPISHSSFKISSDIKFYSISTIINLCLFLSLLIFHWNN